MTKIDKVRRVLVLLESVGELREIFEPEDMDRLDRLVRSMESLLHEMEIDKLVRIKNR